MTLLVVGALVAVAGGYLAHLWRERRRHFQSLQSFFTLDCTFWNQMIQCITGSPEGLFELLTSVQKGIPPGQPQAFVAWILGFPYLVLAGAEELEPLIRSRNINKSREYNVLRNWLADGLFTKSQGEVLVRRLGRLAESGEVFDIWPYFTAATLDSICETMIGRHFNLQGAEEQSTYVRNINTLTELVRERMQKPHLLVDALYYRLPPGRLENQCLQYIHQFADSIIEERWESRVDENANEPRRRAFLDLLIEMVREGKLKRSEIRQEVNTFIFAGHDTSSMGLNWSIFLLGHHTEVQERAYAEICEHIKEEGDWNMENLKKLVYLECVFKESLRLYPPGAMMARRTEVEFSIKGVRVPVGTQVAFSPLAIHREAKHWPDPEVFDPDRFLPHKAAGRHPFAFLPFSAGSRNCIGQRFAILEAKILLGMIIREFTIRSVHERHEVPFM